MSPARIFVAKLTRYGNASLLSAAITLGFPWVAVQQFSMDPDTAAAIAFVLAYVFNFFTMRRYVYQSDGKLKHQVLRYLVVSFGIRVTEFAFYFLLTNFLHFHYMVSLSCVLIISFIAKFFVYKRFVYFDAGHV